MWMAYYGPGLVPPRNIILACRRLRVTFDIEIEMDRFESTRQEALKVGRMTVALRHRSTNASGQQHLLSACNSLQNFDLVARPQGSAQDRIRLAVDSLCTIGPGGSLLARVTSLRLH